MAARAAMYPAVAEPRAIGDLELSTLAAAALDAARRAGATYADVRLTVTRDETVTAGLGGLDDWGITDRMERGVGVRAWKAGGWGFAASPLWTLDEAARLGREAAGQAQINALRGRSPGAFGARPPVVTGTWRTPIQRDPFTVPLAEKLDVIRGLVEVPTRLDFGRRATQGECHVRYWRQEKTFASTEGSLVTQTLYRVDPLYVVSAGTLGRFASRRYDRLRPTAGGWEVLTDPTLVDALLPVAEEACLMLEAERLEPDRYDIVFDAAAMAQIVGRTLGLGAELDRVLGYEANAGGTSYLGPMADRLGMPLGPSWLTVTANRSQPDGVATVAWDDDGVVPDDYPIIQQGALVDYHTTRELAPLLAPWYAKTGRVMRSHGCAGAESALSFPMGQPPNIVLHPAATETTFADLVASLDKGLVICGGSLSMDRQQLNGELMGGGALSYEVRKGKRGRPVNGWQCLLRAPEFWKNLHAVGGPSTQRWSGVTRVPKGQPPQALQFGVAAVPARVNGLAVTTPWRG